MAKNKKAGIRAQIQGMTGPVKPVSKQQDESYIGLEAKYVPHETKSYTASTTAKGLSPKQHRNFSKPHELKKQYNFVIPPSIAESFKRVADRLDMSASAAIAEAMLDFVRKHSE